MNVRSPENPTPANENCTPPVGYFTPPPFAQGGPEGRIFPLLRTAAQIRKTIPGQAAPDIGRGDAVAILTQAAVEYVRTQISDTPPSTALAMALADLAVTGRAAVTDFRVVRPQDALLQNAVQSHYAGNARVTPTLVAASAKAVLDRAYRVLWFLSGQSARGDLNWIAVSGEDDLPHRPVNVPSTKFPQFDLQVTVPSVPPTQGSIVVTTRFAIATANQPAAPPLVPASRSLPPTLQPSLPPKDRIILFIHGSDSRLEEADDLIPNLVRSPDGQPSGFTVISMDLPGSGYVVSSTPAVPGGHPLDHLEVGPWAGVTVITWPIPFGGGAFPFTLLPFLEQFVVNFVPALSSMLGQPGLVESRLAAVIGGSLGGNLSLRLARRSEPWLRNAIAWSPGSIWNIEANQALQIGASGAIPSVNVPEDPTSRGVFFAAAFDQKMNGVNTQPDQWYRDSWPCKPLYIGGARSDRHETYTAAYRRWHWRISFEELIWDWEDSRVQDFKVRLLLGAGSYDDTFPADIYSNTVTVANQLTGTNADSFFLLNTGHSIHAERPIALARKTSSFLARIRDHKSDDYDGDGTSDLAVWRPTDGTWHVTLSSSGAQTVQQWGQAGDIPVPGDYDGDGKTDFAVWRPSEGNWYVINSSTQAHTVRQWGQAGDIPVPGDYDGDGKTDFAVWRPGNGTWYVIDSSTNQTSVVPWPFPANPFPYAQVGDVPVPGDYDGDGRTDLALWRPSIGEWFVQESRGGGLTIPILQQWGQATDVPVPGDYDAAELAVWRPTEGNWYLMDFYTKHQRVQQWGQAGDVPVVGDFDGDGRTDFAVWRPNEANWYLISSSTGAQTKHQLGQFGDIPLPHRPAPFQMAPTPTINTGGTQSPPNTVVDIAAVGANIYYTTDGSVPTLASSLYVGEFQVVAPATIKAIAVATGEEASAIATAQV